MKLTRAAFVMIVMLRKILELFDDKSLNGELYAVVCGYV